MDTFQRQPRVPGPFPLSGTTKSPSIGNQDSFALIRYADSLRGLLAQGDEAALRRHVLKAENFAESAQRVEAIQQAAHHQMSERFRALDTRNFGKLIPTYEDVHVACLGWPVVITMPRELQVSSVYPLNDLHSRPLVKELLGCFRQAYDTGILEVAPLALFQSNLLLGLSPLIVHQLLATFKSALKSSSTPNYRDCQLPILAPREHIKIGPWLPVSMVLPVVVAWRFGQRLLVGSRLRNAQVRMKQLITGLYTHYGQAGHADRSLQDLQAPALQPSVSVGKPELLYEAATQGQWMQLARMAEVASKSGLHTRYTQDALGEFRLLEYELSTDDEMLSTSRYAYEPFWQPAMHREQVDVKLSWAQAMGCTPAMDPQGLH